MKRSINAGKDDFDFEIMDSHGPLRRKLGESCGVQDYMVERNVLMQNRALQSQSTTDALSIPPDEVNESNLNDWKACFIQTLASGPSMSTIDATCENLLSKFAQRLIATCQKNQAIETAALQERLLNAEQIANKLALENKALKRRAEALEEANGRLTQNVKHLQNMLAHAQEYAENLQSGFRNQNPDVF
eukprot:GDKJ01032615.1.p1 GENE.GDKJ01032615.1~~GDKJ01032615.1.p1  ORF type:complete len:197 (-),score=40.96 GDKJ01032615.1:386-952(-)